MCIVLGILILALLAYIVYLYASYYRIEDNQELVVEAPVDDTTTGAAAVLATGTEYSAVTFGSKVITSIPFRVAPLKSPSKTVPSLFVIAPVNVPPLMVPLLSFMTSFLNVPFRMVPVLVTLPWNSVLPAAPSLPVIVPVPYSLPFVTVPDISPPSAFRMPTFVTSV